MSGAVAHIEPVYQVILHKINKFSLWATAADTFSFSKNYEKICNPYTYSSWYMCIFMGIKQYLNLRANIEINCTLFFIEVIFVSIAFFE